MIMTKEKWLELLRDKQAYCYIKPNRHIHDSGWRCFEVGYMTLGEWNKVKDKLVLGDYSDHIQPFDYLDFKDGNVSSLNIDLTRDGYIRIHSHISIWWGSIDYAVSSATIQQLKK